MVKLLSFKQVRRVPVLEPKVSEELLQTFPAHKHCVSPHCRTKSGAKSDFNVALKTGPYEAVHLYLQVNQLVAFQVVHDDVFMVGLPHFGVGADNRTGLRLYSVLPLSFVCKILLFLLVPCVGFVIDEPLRLFLILFLLDLLQNPDVVVVAVNALESH